MDNIYKGDDTGAFNQDFILINANIPTGWNVTRAEFKVGKLPVIIFRNPVFPIKVQLTSAQTSRLCDVNQCHLAVYDDLNRKQTCTGTLVFKANDAVVI